MLSHRSPLSCRCLGSTAPVIVGQSGRASRRPDPGTQAGGRGRLRLLPKLTTRPGCPCCFYGPCVSAFCQAVRQNLRCPCNPCRSPSISVSPYAQRTRAPPGTEPCGRAWIQTEPLPALMPPARTGRPLASEGGAGPAASVVAAPLSRTASRDRILRVDPGGHCARRRWPPRRRLRGGGDLRGESQRGVRNERGIPPPPVVTAGRAGDEAHRPLHDLRADRRQLYPDRPPRSPAIVECRDGVDRVGRGLDGRPPDGRPSRPSPSGAAGPVPGARVAADRGREPARARA